MGSRMKYTSTIFSIITVFGFLLIAGTSCNKDTKCQGDVYVIRGDNGHVITGAKVWSRYAAKSDSQHTDAAGHIHLELDLPAILTVTAYKPAGAPNALNPAPILDSASTTLKFEAGKTNSVTIKL
jgi:hypothetical protein